MRIITGSTGSTHVTSNNDGEFNQAIFGEGLIVFENGNALNATIVDNNTIRVSDGDLVLQGRHALIEPNTTEDIIIETGAVGVNRNDLIVARYVLDTATGYEDITLEVLKGTETSGAAVDPEITTGDIRTGSKLVEAALYRVKIEGINIVSLEKLFTVTDNLIDMIIDLKKKDSELNSKYEECFQSVSNGKKKVASAITGKGVTTPSDATFETMANNIGAIPVGKCISLGNGTSFDVKTVCANNGIDYTKLTVNNFIVGVSKMPSMNTSSDNNKLSDSGWGYICATGFTVSKNYSNGVLTISNIAQTLYVQDSLGSGQRQNKTQTATCFAYLVYTG